MGVLTKGAKKSHISLHLFTLTHNYINGEVNLNHFETFDLMILTLVNTK